VETRHRPWRIVVVLSWYGHAGLPKAPLSTYCAPLPSRSLP
jgi:hypothetical protein